MTDDRYSDPHQIGDDVEWCVSSNDRWIAQWNAAVDRVRHEWSLVLAPGILLEDDWYRTLNDSLSDSVVAVSPSLVSALDSSQIIATGVGLKPDGSIRPIVSRKRAKGQRKPGSIDAPGIFAGAWRSTLLKSLAPWDDAWTFADLGLDLAHALRTRRLAAIQSEQWVVSVEEPSQVLEAFARPRGTTIERCLVRHQSRSRRRRCGSLAYRLASDLLACPSQPWRVAQAWQRLTAGKYRREDMRFRQRCLAAESDTSLTGETMQKFPKAA